MEVITIETLTFKRLVQRIENMEQMMLSVTKIVREEKKENAVLQPEFISREAAMAEFGLSHTTVDFKIKKYNVPRLQSGGKKLLNRAEFIKALQNKEPFTKVINS